MFFGPCAVILIFLGSGAVCLAHCDGSSTCTEVPLLVKAVTSLSNFAKEGRYETHRHRKALDKITLAFKLLVFSALDSSGLNYIWLEGLTMTQKYPTSSAVTYWV